MKIKNLMRKSILAGLLLLFLLTFTNRKKTIKCYNPPKADQVADEIMQEKSLHLVMQTMDDNNILTDIKWVHPLANTLARQSDEYIRYAKKNPELKLSTVKEGTRTCGVPDAVYQLGIDRIMLRKINRSEDVILHD